MNGRQRTRQRTRIRASDAPRFTEGAVSGHVIRLSGFMIMGFLAMTVAQLIEAVYLGLVGTDELAAVAFTFPVVMALSAMTRGIGIGTGAVLARTMGGGDRERSARLASHGLLLVLAFTLVCSFLLITYAHQLFALLGAREHTLDLVVSYVVIFAFGFPFFGLSMVGAGLMRSIGDPRFPGYVLAGGSVAQVVLGPFLIFGWLGLPAMGIEGAAWAFALARGVSFVMVVYWFFVKEQMFRSSLDSFGESCRAILHVGIPAMVSNMVQPISMAITTRLLAGMGAGVVAGFGVASRFESLIHMVIIGIASSTGPLVGQNWGARKFDRVNEVLRIANRYCLSWSVIGATIMWIGAAFLVGLVNEDAVLLATAIAFLYIVPISEGFEGLVGVATGSFNALSKPMPPLAVSVFRTLIVYVPMAIIGARLFGYVGVFVATAVANVLGGSAAWVWNRRMLQTQRSRMEAAAV